MRITMIGNTSTLLTSSYDIIMTPRIMFVLVDPYLSTNATLSEVRGYGHTHLLYVAEQWEREGKPDVSLRGFEGDVCVVCLDIKVSAGFLASILLNG